MWHERRRRDGTLVGKKGENQIWFHFENLLSIKVCPGSCLGKRWWYSVKSDTTLPLKKSPIQDAWVRKHSEVNNFRKSEVERQYFVIGVFRGRTANPVGLQRVKMEDYLQEIIMPLSCKTLAKWLLSRAYSGVSFFLPFCPPAAFY